MTKQQIINQMQERLDAHSREIGRLQVQREALVETLQFCITEPGACCLTVALDRRADFMLRRLNAITEFAKHAIAKACGQEGKEGAQ